MLKQLIYQGLNYGKAAGKQLKLLAAGVHSKL